MSIEGIKDTMLRKLYQMCCKPIQIKVLKHNLMTGNFDDTVNMYQTTGDNGQWISTFYVCP